jgi:streptogramin lyase
MSTEIGNKPGSAQRGVIAILIAAAFLLISMPTHAATGQLQAAGVFAAGIFDNSNGFNPRYAGISAPHGGLMLDSHFWVCDDLDNVIKLTFDPEVGIAEPHSTALDWTNDVLNIANSGQPAFDASRNLIYVPSSQNRYGGVYRSVFTAGKDGDSFGPPVLLAASAGLSGPRPSSVVLGPDGQLYVGFLGTGDVRRINNPTAFTQTVQTIGKSSKGGRVFGLAFVGNDLYLAEKDGLSVIRNATSCNSGCQATVLPNSTRDDHTGIATDGIDTIYVAASNAILRYTISTQTQVLFANSGQLPDGTIVPFAIPSGQTTAVVLDPLGNLWVGDDITGGLTRFNGRLWLIPAGSSPVQ